MPLSPSDPAQDPGFPARDGLLPPALRRDLTDLNAQYLDLGRVADPPGDPRFGWADPVRRRLSELDGPTRLRIAAAPFALFRLVAPPQEPGTPPPPQMSGGVHAGPQLGIRLPQPSPAAPQV